MTNLIKSLGSQDSGTMEFYTVEDTGESGMSQSGLAVLCGVSQSAIAQLENTLISKASSKWLEPLVGQDLTLTSNDSDPSFTVDGKPAGKIRIYKAAVCARIIQHYAFRGNEVAQ